MSNLELYNKVRSVPSEAQKEIQAGRLKGKTDINPMWRIKVLTEQFGVCGFGWKTEIVREWLEQGAGGEVTANVEIRLYAKLDGYDGAWSDPIPGIGGSALVAKEKNGLFTDDDCYKKAYTDAISVACKALGIGADVYYAKDSTKYDTRTQTDPQSSSAPIRQTYDNAPKDTVSETKSQRTLQLEYLIKDTKHTLDEANEFAQKGYMVKSYEDLTIPQFNNLYDRLEKKIEEEKHGGK